MTDHKKNCWKGLVLGALGGVAGVLAMRAYWQRVTQSLGYDPRKKQKSQDEPQPLDDISLFGKQHKEGESSTAALGRIAYQQITGKEPSAETKTTLSYLVHWLISMQASGLYGAIQGRASLLDFEGGWKLAVGLWLFGDELIQPLIGVTDGPTAYPAELHAYSLGAHVAYGLASALATQFLYRLFP